MVRGESLALGVGMSNGSGSGFGSDALRRGFEDLAARAAAEAVLSLGSRIRDAGRKRDDDAPRDGFDRAAGYAHGAANGYRNAKDKAGRKVAGVVSKGTHAVDRAVGDTPWKTIGMDGRDTAVARRVMTDVVPDVVGNRVSSLVDGIAVKAGVVGLGVALKLPLRSVALPVLAGLAAAEAAKAVQEVKGRLPEVEASVDRDLGATHRAPCGTMG